jgi:hypothetical protein
MRLGYRVSMSPLLEEGPNTVHEDAGWWWHTFPWKRSLTNPRMHHVSAETLTDHPADAKRFRGNVGNDPQALGAAFPRKRPSSSARGPNALAVSVI